MIEGLELMLERNNAFIRIGINKKVRVVKYNIPNQPSQIISTSMNLLARNISLLMFLYFQ